MSARGAGPSCGTRPARLALCEGAERAALSQGRTRQSTAQAAGFEYRILGLASAAPSRCGLSRSSNSCTLSGLKLKNVMVEKLFPLKAHAWGRR